MTRPAMTRLADWRGRLADHLAAARRKPFRYGSHDCASFAAGAVRAVTGIDPCAALGIRYTTLAGGRRALAARGYPDPVACVRASFPEIPAALARMGDLAVVATDDGPALAVVGGAVLLAPRLPGGLAVLPFTAAAAAFEVGA